MVKKYKEILIEWLKYRRIWRKIFEKLPPKAVKPLTIRKFLSWARHEPPQKGKNSQPLHLDLLKKTLIPLKVFQNLVQMGIFDQFYSIFLSFFRGNFFCEDEFLSEILKSHSFISLITPQKRHLEKKWNIQRRSQWKMLQDRN